MPRSHCFLFNDTATTDFYTLSLHDAFRSKKLAAGTSCSSRGGIRIRMSRSAAATNETESTASAIPGLPADPDPRSEEHTSELQSHSDLVCRLLLEKNKRLRSHLHPHRGFL